jgi:hypothetical protein
LIILREKRLLTIMSHLLVSRVLSAPQRDVYLLEITTETRYESRHVKFFFMYSGVCYNGDIVMRDADI